MMDLGQFQEKYRIHESYGFLPYPAPLEQLQEEPFVSSWELLVKKIPLYVGKEQEKLIEMIDNMPLIEDLSQITVNSGDVRKSQRAFVVLSFLAHFYVWSQFPSLVRDRIPDSVAKPWIAISDYLGLNPVLCHAGVVLWNWKFIKCSKDHHDDPSDLDQLEILDTASCTTDEAWFYLTTTAIEAAGGSLPWLFYKTQQQVLRLSSQVNEASLQAVTETLMEMKKGLVKINDLMRRMYEKNSPPVFYERVRPFLTGWENCPFLPHGLQYGSESHRRKYAGGSAAQSSLIQSFDVFLGVRHKPPSPSTPSNHQQQQQQQEHPPDDPRRKESSASFENIVLRLEEQDKESPKKSIPLAYDKLHELKMREREAAATSANIIEQESNTESDPSNNGNNSSSFLSFQAKMRYHMPLQHRMYLEDLAAGPCVHDFIQSVPEHLKSSPFFARLKGQFDECVAELRLFRDKHIQMVSVYILIQSKKSVRGNGRNFNHSLPKAKQR